MDWRGKVCRQPMEKKGDLLLAGCQKAQEFQNLQWFLPACVRTLGNSDEVWRLL